jgi:hypothetical protein
MDDFLSIIAHELRTPLTAAFGKRNDRLWWMVQWSDEGSELDRVTVVQDIDTSSLLSGEVLIPPQRWAMVRSVLVYFGMDSVGRRGSSGEKAA